jgi:predicted dehydrogenase
MKLTRRRFIQSAAIASGAVAMPMISRGRVLGANEEIRVGVIGLGIRGAGTHLPSFNALPSCAVTALCDADMSRTDSVSAAAKDKFGREIKKYQDLRELINDPDIDAISVATLQHWHALATVWGCMGGKDVYVEKPACHYMREAAIMEGAARRHEKIVQVGTQRRSQIDVRQTIRWLQDEPLGKITHIIVGASKPRSSLGTRTTPLPIPDCVDYDLWCGPGRKVDLYREKLQYDGNFDFNTGDGDSCNQGTHEIDIARWALGETALPRRAMSIATSEGFENDSADVARVQVSYYDYETAPVFQWTSNLRQSKSDGGSPRYQGTGTTTVVYCEAGRVDILGRAAYDIDGNRVPIELPSNIEFNPGSGNHFQNFLDAVRSRKSEDLNADIAQGALSTNVTHVGNISFRVGQSEDPATIKDSIADTPSEYRAMYDWMIEHCAANEVDLSAGQLSLGPMLEIGENWRPFENNSEANELAYGFEREGWRFPMLE